MSKVVAAIAMMALAACARPEYTAFGGLGTTAGAMVLMNNDDSDTRTAIGVGLVAAGIGVIIYGMMLKPRGLYTSRS